VLPCRQRWPASPFPSAWRGSAGTLGSTRCPVRRHAASGSGRTRSQPKPRAPRRVAGAVTTFQNRSRTFQLGAVLLLFVCLGLIKENAQLLFTCLLLLLWRLME
jgi:hypothetical protein